MLTPTEENYLKAIYKLSGNEKEFVSTSKLAETLNTSAASATDMIQRLGKKGLVHYHKYQGVSTSPSGEKAALQVIRRHRLWEVFLVQKLKFNWNEVHAIAEELEHIKSPQLIAQLDKFLAHPKYDPHGDPIPDAEGKMAPRPTTTLKMLATGDLGKVISTKDSSSDFLLFLDKLNISLGAEIELLDYFAYDGTYSVRINHGPAITLSGKVAGNIFIEKL